MTRTPEDDAVWQAALGDAGAAANGHLEPERSSTTWLPVDLAPVVAGIQAGEIVGPVPKLMPRTDGQCLLYPGEVHSLAGEPETGKGWIALAAAALVIANGQHVLYLDFEDAAPSIITRLLALGAQPDAIVDRFAYVRPSDPFAGATLDVLLAQHRYELAIIDGLSEAYALLGLDPYSNLDAAVFLARLARPIGATGAAVLLIDHVTKAKDTRSRYALGAQHKLAGIAVAYSTDAIATPSRTHPGHIKLRVEKDRHGHVRSHAQASVIAQAHITPKDDGHTVTVTLDPPETTISETGDFIPTVLMARVSEYVQSEPGASLNAIKRGVDGRNEWIAKALNLLVADGYIDRRKKGQTNTHHHVKTYTPSPSPTESQPIPGPGPSNRVPESPPIRDSDSGPSHRNHQDRFPNPADNSATAARQVDDVGSGVHKSERGTTALTADGEFTELDAAAVAHGDDEA